MEASPRKLIEVADGFRMGMFAMDLETCLLTPEGPVTQVIKLLNVLSFSCICLKCSECFDNKSTLLFHMQKHRESDEYHEEPSELSRESNEIQLKNIYIGNPVASRLAEKQSVKAKLHDDSYVDDDDAASGTEDDNGRCTDDRSEISADNGSCTDNCDVSGNNEDIFIGVGVGVGWADNIIGAHNAVSNSTDIQDDADIIGADNDTEHGASADIFETDNGAVSSTDKTDICGAGANIHGDDSIPVTDDNDDGETDDICGADVVRDDDCDSDDDKTDTPMLDRLEKRVSNKSKIEMKCGGSPAEQKPYRCTACGKTFSRRPDLKRHIVIHSGSRTKEKPNRCTVCGKTFSRPSDLKRHITIHTKKNVYPCPVRVCREQFTNDVELKEHIKIHTLVVGDITKYICPLCEKQAARIGDLIKHIRIHTGEKPFKCTVCGKQFPYANSLKEHGFTHTSEKPWRCTICGKRFYSGARVNNHMQTHPGYKQSFECTICGKILTRPHNLKVHMAHVHEGKSVACSVCGKNFKHSSSLKRHVRTEHEGKSLARLHEGQSVACSICGKNFKHSSSLKRHVRTEHEGK